MWHLRVDLIGTNPDIQHSYIKFENGWIDKTLIIYQKPYEHMDRLIGIFLIVYGVLVTIQGLELPTALSGWVAIALCALFSTIFGIVCLFAGLKRIDPANTAMISTLEVIVASALGPRKK